MDEELKNQTEGQMVEDFVNSDGWKYAMNKLDIILNRIDAISSLPDSLTKEQKLEEMERRQGAISLIKIWRDEIEGRAEQHNNNKVPPEKIDNEILITY